MRYAAPLAICAAVLIAACDGAVTGTDTRTDVASVSVTPDQATLAVGATQALAAVLRASDGAVLTGRAVAWQSSDSLVARVSATGVVTARAAGSALITAASGGRSGEARITVPAPAPVVDRVELDRTAATLQEGQLLQLVATPRDAAGGALAGLGVQWSSSVPDVAAVSALGAVTAVRPGTATVTARVHGKEVSATVTVSTAYAYDLLYAAGTAAGGFELFRLDVGTAGAAAARPFPAGRRAFAPAPAPDGSRIAYVCPSDAGDPSLCVADADGSGARLLRTEAGASLGEPRWSPDGQRLAYTRTEANGTARVWAMDADGTGATALTAGMDGSQRSPAWSPVLADGTRRIAFSGGTGSQLRIWSMREDGTDRRPVTAGADLLDASPAWSPDGQTIAFVRTSPTVLADVWRVDAAGGDERSLGAALAGAQTAPAWSPDGRMVAFVSAHEAAGGAPGTQQVYTVWGDGSKLARRTFDAGDKFAPAWLARR